MGESVGERGDAGQVECHPVPTEQFKRYAVPAGIDRAAEFCGSVGRLVRDEFDEITGLDDRSGGLASRKDPGDDDSSGKLERIRDIASPSGREIDLETSPGGVSVFRYDQPAATAMPKSIRC